MVRLEKLVNSTKPIRAGEIVYRQGSQFDKIYAIKSGSLKSVAVDESGDEKIIGFHLPGELLGIEGVYPEEYPASTIALETVVMCEMDYTGLTKLCTEIPSLQNQVFRLLSRDINLSQAEHSKSVDQTAEQKLANFLNNLSARYEARGFSQTEFPLTMTRQDIARYLGMAPETVSRLLKRFKEQNVIEINRGTISLSDTQALEDIVVCAVR